MFRINAASLSVLIYCTSVTYTWVNKKKTFYNLKMFFNKSDVIECQFQPILKAVLVNHTQTFDADYISYNITPTRAGTHDVYVHIRKSNMNLFTKVAVNFETNPNEYGYQFMNKTFSTCKFYNSKRFEPLLQILYRVAVENPSVLLPRRCPIKSVQ